MVAVPRFRSLFGFKASARYCDEPDFLIFQWHGRSGRICPTLDLVSQGHRRERWRLAANPSRSDQFGPWHLADLVGPPDAAELPPNPLNDAFAMRYRVL
jgi:hypothetical protein